jgi:hypothetical protein
MVNGTLVFQIKFCGKSPALRVAAKRYWQVVCDSPKFKNPTQQIEKLNFVVWKPKNTID